MTVPDGQHLDFAKHPLDALGAHDLAEHRPRLATVRLVPRMRTVTVVERRPTDPSWVAHLPSTFYFEPVRLAS